MRFGVRPENLVELVGSKLNIAPVPVAEAVFGMAASRVVMAGVRLGLFARLARAEAGAAELASELDLIPAGLEHLLACLAALGHVEQRSKRWRLTRSAKPWLDPRSKRYVGNFIEHNYEAWSWWSELERVVKTGQSFEIHGAGPDDPHWRRYILGQYELARLSAPEVARAIELPKSSGGAKTMIDLAGGHGWFSAELCRANPRLSATIVDLPGSAAIGREIIAREGMSARVRFSEGDMFRAELGGPHALALCFNIIHHLAPESIVLLFRRIAAALEKGGKIAVLDLFNKPQGEKPNSSAFLGMFFYLTSGAATYSPADLRGWLADAGFGPPRRVQVRRIPAQTLYVARKK